MGVRDLLLITLLVLGLPVALARPYYGACVFAWLALMNPHRLTWGPAESFPWSMLYGATTCVGLIFHRDKLISDSVRRLAPVLAYTGWMLVTTIFAFLPDYALGRFDGVWKSQLMCLVTLCLLTSRRRIHIFAVLCIASIVFYGAKGGLFTLISGGDYRVWGPRGSVIADNNQLAAGLVVTLPLLFWLFRIQTRRWMKVAIAVVGTLTVISVFGSHSRGAFLAVVAMAAFLWLRSDRKLALALLIPLVAVFVTVLMPDQYWRRIDSISDYQEDSSAQGRLNTWTTAFNIANSRLTGGGFEYYSPEVFAIYAPRPGDVHSSHSIYFQALGEHGWIGLLLFLWILVWAWRMAARVARQPRHSTDDANFPLLGRMVQVALVGYAVGGAFVNIGNWDCIYYVMAIQCAVQRLYESSRMSPVELARASRIGTATPSRGAL